MLYAERHRPRGVGLAGAVHRTCAVAGKNDWQFSNPRIDTDSKSTNKILLGDTSSHKFTLHLPPFSTYDCNSIIHSLLLMLAINVFDFILNYSQRVTEG